MNADVSFGLPYPGFYTELRNKWIWVWRIQPNAAIERSEEESISPMIDQVTRSNRRLFLNVTKGP